MKKATGLSECGQVGIFLLYLVYRALTGGISKELTLLVGTLYPVLKSIEALQTDTDVEDDKTWLTYWICFGLTYVLDTHIGWIIRIPQSYYIVKAGVLIWL